MEALAKEEAEAKAKRERIELMHKQVRLSLRLMGSEGV
jgi:hypothetical protein